MLKTFHKVYFVYILVDLILIGLIFYIAYILRYNSLKDIFATGNISLPNFGKYTFALILWVIFIFIGFKKRRLYNTDRSKTIPKEINDVFISVLYASVLVSAVTFFGQYKFFSRKVFLINAILFFVFLSGWRVIKRLMLRKLILKGFHNINVLIIGAGEKGRMILDEIKALPWWGFKVTGFLDDNKKGAIDSVPILGKIENFSAILQKYFIDEVIITEPLSGRLMRELICKEKNGCGIRIVPEALEEDLSVYNKSYLGAIPLWSYQERVFHASFYGTKRLFDFALSLILLIVLSPVFLIISILVKLDSEGPVFFIQKRVNMKGMPFKFYKFRSMVKDAEQLKECLLQKNEVKGGVIFKMKKDPRITDLGRFLRKYSLDELPQLFNVLKGNMSLVGPRPPTVDEIQKYSYKHMQRLSIKPGITGIAQLKGRSSLTFHKWSKWDLWYINNWTFGLDLWILAQTIPAVIKGKNAY